MSRRTTLFALAAMLIAGLPATAASEALDLIPEDAALGVVIRNIGDLTKKGDKFLASAGFKKDGMTPDDIPFPSTIYTFLCEFLDLKTGIDEDAPAALILTTAKGKKPESDDDFFIVLAVPFKDRHHIAKNFKKRGFELKEGKVFPREAKSRFDPFNKYCVHNKHLLLGNNEKALEYVLKSEKSAAQSLSDADRKSLADADALLYFRPDRGILVSKLDFLGLIPEDVFDVLKTMRVGWALSHQRRHRHQSYRRLPGEAAGGHAQIPDDPGGHAGRLRPEGTARRPGDLRRRIEGRRATKRALDESAGRCRPRSPLPMEGEERLPTPTDRANVLAALSEVTKRLEGHRLAVYQNADPSRNGLLSVVAILDTADADKFLTDMKHFARLSGTDGLDLSAKGNKDDVAAVEKLVRDLGDDDFEVRESASDRLKLIGEPALPVIEKALQSKDAEVHRRAEDLIRVIHETAVARRKDLLSKDAPWRLRPTFQFEAKAEERDGRKIETARIRLTEKDAPAAAALRSVFGPDWDRIRLAAQGKQVVVLFGSDTKLLDAALANLKDGKPGLAAAKSLSGFNKQADAARKLELHGSAAALLALLRGGDLPRLKAGTAPSLTSASVSVGADRVRLDFWLPPSELESMWKKPEQ